jgi:DNA (cytosine-5)-methyltransferase 1/DNA (cytosine-5)-methyltransferase 3A
MSFGKMALESLDIKVNKYYSSEIDKYANQATQAMFPDTIQLGDVTQWREWDIESSIDLVTGGFPCQAWSMAGKQLGDKDERGMLFWTMLDIMKHVKYHNPKADFMIENVKMKKEFEQYITTHTENALGHVHKILINSALVSAQNRNRYYWTSFEVKQPEDKGILLKSIVEINPDIKFELSDKLINGFYNKKGGFNGRFNPMNSRLKEKSYCLTARYFKCGATDPYIITGETNQNLYGVTARKLTPRECFRLQTVPEHHIDTLLNSGISNTQLYKMCGNGWTMEVIKHIFKGL